MNVRLDILTATPQPPMWTFLKRLLQKPKPDLTGADLMLGIGNLHGQHLQSLRNSLGETLWHGVMS